jgi:hypothetical protein
MQRALRYYASLGLTLGAIAAGTLPFNLAAAQSKAHPLTAKPLAHPAKTPLAHSAQAPLAPDDVSWLFPSPRSQADFSRLIAVSDLSGVDPADPTKRAPIWPDEIFQQFLAIADSDAGKIPGATERMHLPPEARKRENWHIVSLRVDPGAPGLSPAIRGQFGQLPQIRLVAQPVIVNPDKTVRVFDMTAHLIFNFASGADTPAQPGCFARPQPDMAAFKAILADFAGLRSKLAQGGFGGAKILTAAKPLGVHPGLADKRSGAALRDALKAVLEQHLSSGRLGAMAVMALPDQSPEPWMFLSMLAVPPGATPQLPKGGFIPVRSPALDGAQFTEALAARADLTVEPAPAPNNLNPITCQNGALTPPLPVAGRRGAATAELFHSPPPGPARVKQVVDLIADPTRSHFFNTDCVSCHTETRRAIDLLKVKSVPGVDSAVLPKDIWNVRNFGWFPSFPAAQETATRRTGAETAAVLQFIKANGLLK